MKQNKINTVYKDRLIASELGVVIGAITQSQELIDHALVKFVVFPWD